MISRFLIILIFLALIGQVTSISNTTTCYCDCCIGTSCIANFTSVSVPETDTCFELNCNNKCVAEFPSICGSNDNNTMITQCSSYFANYSNNPSWVGNYQTIATTIVGENSICNPRECCCLESFKIEPALEIIGFQLTARLSGDACTSSITEITFPVPSGNIISFIF